MRRFRPATAGLVTVIAALTSCGDDDSGDAGPEPVTIEITVEDGAVEPSGDVVDVAVGQPIELVVKADSSGELHVHADPEQDLEYAEGTTTLPLTIDKPGVVDIESHDPEQVIVRLEVE